GRELPVVAVGRRMQSASLDVVRAADDLGVAEAVAHLAGLGHRDIAFVDGGRGVIAAAPSPLDGHTPAVIASTARCAVGLLDRFARLGAEVPGDISVVGYDDST